MGVELPLGRTHRGLEASRFRNTVYGYIKSLWNTILPVQVVGHQDFSDTERPDWHIFAYSIHQANQYSSASISSYVDIAIEAINVLATDGAGSPRAGAVYMYTPVISYIPWGGAAPVVYWVPGVRPRLQFDLGNTFVITGSQGPAFTPITGWLQMAELGVGNNNANSIIRFDPPFILPATMYLTIQLSLQQHRLYSSWRYREIG